MDVLKEVASYGVLPVLGLKKPDTVPMLAETLRRSGLPLVEVTMRAERALDCLKIIKESEPDMLVGAGTILSVDQVQRVVDAGADYIVTPCFNPTVVDYCLEKGIPVVPGCVTATEIDAAARRGLSTVKFFPAGASGGIAAIKLLSGPFPGMKFVPTGGITLDNMGEYLSNSSVAAVGGSFMAPAAMIDAEDWEGISTLCKKAVKASLGFELAHVGINGNSREEGLGNAQWFNDCFGFAVTPGGRSNFAESYVECCNQPFPGKLGHIAFSCLSPARAAAYFERKGVVLREETKAFDKNGELKFVYLQDEVGGFAVHIVKKG